MDELIISLTQEDREGVLHYLQQVPSIAELISQLKAFGIDLVHEVCKAGYSDIMEMIITDVGIEVLDSDLPEPLVVTACRYNRPEMLRLLLFRGMPILSEGVQVWQKSSPLYIASEKGYLEIAQILLDTQPSLVKNEDVRSCLLYAACLGGHIPLVKMWMLPSMDINHPLKLVDSLEDCENKTPLYAACSGDHEEVVRFLGSCHELEFTENVCNSFPYITGRIINDFFTKASHLSINTSSATTAGDDGGDGKDEVDIIDNLFELYVGDVHGKHLHALHSSWLMPYCVTLVELDISDNLISELPDCLPWSFQNLRSFIAMRNRLKFLARPPRSSNGEELCPRLEHVNLSNNKLELVCRELFEIKSLTNINLSYNCLSYLYKNYHQKGEFQQNQHEILRRQSSALPPWNCHQLKTLDLSHNNLQMLPEDIKACTSLIQLIANNNCLITFPQPWDCPLQLLDLSYNSLERFPVNTEQYWCGSLKTLNISRNKLDEINEGIFKLNVLTDLNASHNTIERLPPPEHWECGQLYCLDLRHNCLGLPREKHSYRSPLAKLKSKARPSSMVETRLIHFPELMEGCLKELRLADNNLDCVPLSVCNLRQLEILDLSNNPLIKHLPKEIGKLKNLGRLKLDSLKLENVPLEMYTRKSNHTKDIVFMFQEILRDCRPYCKIKTVVIGKKDKGKTSLVSLLAGRKGPKMEETKSIVREEITLTKRKDSFHSIFSIEKKTEVNLNVWDMAGDEAYTLIYHSMFTSHSLYLVVWDFWSIETELDKIGQLIYNIQASTSFFRAIIVGTFFDKRTVSSEEKTRAVAKLQAGIDAYFSTYEPITVCPVSCITQEGIHNLRDLIFTTAINMKGHKRGQLLIEQKVPNSYLWLAGQLEAMLKSLTAVKEPPCLTQKQFSELIENATQMDSSMGTTEENVAVIKFLKESGSLLHFSDQLGSLNTLYFLDPAWLSDVLVHILINKEGRSLLKTGTGKIRKADVSQIYKEDPRFPAQYLSQYLELLERFEIAVSVGSTGKMFFPCQLPENPPMNEASLSEDSRCNIIQRMYRMAECPSGFWTRLLTRMMTRVEQFSAAAWYFKPTMSQSVRKMPMSVNGSPRIKREQSVHGLHLVNPTKTFCREWIYVQHSKGSFCIEPLNMAKVHDSNDTLQKGVLITETSSTDNFGVMGMITDEIEDIIQDFYPGLLEIDEHTMQNRLARYAVCPTCYHEDLVTKDINHFTMEHCARMLVKGTTITCPRGVQQDLHSLVPDLLMKELPSKFFLDPAHLQLEESQQTFLGGGVMGSVFKAKYKDQMVAVKVYRSDIRNQRGAGCYGTQVSCASDSGTATMSTQGSNTGDLMDQSEADTVYANCRRNLVDLDEAESIKALRAIREMRQEVALTSRLQHPCIISLVGITFSPKLMMALELAPLGSLQSLLENKLKQRKPFDKYRHKDIVFEPLFNKELTYKFVYQIAKGLAYLHSNGIIYKDLKSDNILVMSEDLNAPVNLKLSDYGISKYCWSGRSVGLVGTPGYQAPEILEGLAYDEKVDIFSFAMVIYEVFTGRRPFMEFESMALISKAIKTDGKRPSVKDFFIETQFPYLEELMGRCWQKHAPKRPDAMTIVSKRCMASLQFVSQRASFKNSFVSRKNIKTEFVFSVSNIKESPLLWIWDGEDADRSCSVFDLETSKFRVRAFRLPGAAVTCAAKVEKHFWLGVENNEIEIYSQDQHGSPLGLFDRCSLDAKPVQILCVHQVSNVGNNTEIYVGLDDAKVLMYKLSTRRNAVHQRRTYKKVEGYTLPKQVVLRAEKLICLAHCDNSNDVWVSTNGYVDIISCLDFKVKKEERIVLKNINRLCGINALLDIVKLESSKNGQMFGLLGGSPYVYEFDTNSYTCVSVITLDRDHHEGVSVLTVLDLDQAAYKDCDGCWADSVRHSVYGASQSSGGSGSLQKGRNAWTSEIQCEGHCREQDGLPISGREPVCGDDNQTRGSPILPPRKKSGRNYENIPPTNKEDSETVEDFETNVKLSTDHEPGAVDTGQNGNEVTKSEDVSDTLENTEQDVKGYKATSARKAEQFFGEDIPPVVPPRTYRNTEDSSRKFPVHKQPSFSLPTYMRHAHLVTFDTTVTSIALVDDALWVGSSHGDIRVVDVRRSNDADRIERGKIIAIMKRLNHIDQDDIEEGGVNLLEAGKFVVSAHRLSVEKGNDKDKNFEAIEVTSWDSYNTRDIARFNKHWMSVINIEKGLAFWEEEEEEERYSV